VRHAGLLVCRCSLNGGEGCVSSPFIEFHENMGSHQILSWLRSSAFPGIWMRPLFHVSTVSIHGLELCAGVSLEGGS